MSEENKKEEIKDLENANNANISESAKPPADPYSKVEFDMFLKEIGNANLPNWNVLAEALGVSQATIIRWKNHPLAKQAMSAAIEENIRKMSEAGKDDWKMYREKLKMLGVKDKQTVEHEGEINVTTNKEVADALREIIEQDDTLTAKDDSGSQAPDPQQVQEQKEGSV